MFTFKTERPTGPYKSFFSATHDIKLKGVVCGSIDDEKPHAIRFMKLKYDLMEDGNPNCAWRWTKLKKDFTSVQEAKDFLKGNFEKITNSINIYIGQ